jgi:two-component system, response regulator YesN
MTNRNSRSLFRKLFISYILICSIPLLLFVGTFYYHNVINFRKEVTDSNLSKLTHINNQIDLDLKAFKDIAYHISSNSYMMDLKTSQQGYITEGLEIQLKAYMDNMPSLDEVAYYYRGDDFIHTSKGKFHYSVFEEQVKGDIDWTQTSFFKNLNTIIAPASKSIEIKSESGIGKSNMLTVMFPIPYLSTLPKSTITFMINESSVAARFKNFFGDFKGYIYIYDNYYNTLISSNYGITQGNTKIFEEKLRHINGTGVNILKFENDNYVVMRVVSEETGWSYVAAMLPSQFYKRANLMRTIVIVSIFIIVLGVLGSALIVSTRNYKPIEMLLSYIKKQEPQMLDIEGKDELDVIRFTFENAIKQNRELIVQADAQRPLVKDQCLLKILRGKVSDQNELDYLMKCSNVQLRGTAFFTMVLSIRGKTSSQDNIAKVFKLLEYAELEGGRLYGVELVHEKLIAILVSLEEEKDSYEEIKTSIANSIHSIVERSLGLNVIIGIGNIYKSILQLNTSFLEASAVLSDNIYNSHSSIHCYNQIVRTQEQFFWYPIMEQALFLQSLKHGDKAVAVDTLNIMVDKITNCTTSYPMVKCLCFDIINNMIKTINQMNIDNFSEDIKGLVEFDSLEEFKSRMEEFASKFCEQAERFKESHVNELKNNIINDVNSCFRDCNISLETVADKFDISTTYLSRFFKAETGVNFIEYITNLRMDEVKTQLRSTEKPIKDIVKEVGYIDSASFARKFKSLEGITPGQYREMTKRSI